MAVLCGTRCRFRLVEGNRFNGGERVCPMWDGAGIWGTSRVKGEE